MTANILSPYQGTGEQKPASLRYKFFLGAADAPCPLASLHTLKSLGSRVVFLDQARPGTRGCLWSPCQWRKGTNAVATCRVLPFPSSPNSMTLCSCIFVWRLSSEMTISMRQRLAELRQHQRGGKQQGPPSPQRSAGPNW